MNLLFHRILPALLGLAVSCSSLLADERPIILWLTCEDNNINWIGCYGNPYADTPNIDKLASEGFQYMNCYANAPVCAPSRCTWITGIHAVSMGTHPMRSRYEIPHDRIKYYPDYLKEAGYYVVNAGKTDYNIGGRDDKEPWDSNKPDFQAAKDNQPFFMIINSTKSHESRAFGDINNSEHSPGHVQLAKYHPDIPEMRKNYAMALFFGFIHGMGFSNFFRALLMGDSSIFVPLLGFNIGIEFGQLIIVGGIVGIAYGVMRYLKVQHREWNLFISGGAAGVAIYLMFQAKFW